jgi:hypothetical protein
LPAPDVTTMLAVSVMACPQTVALATLVAATVETSEPVVMPLRSVGVDGCVLFPLPLTSAPRRHRRSDHALHQ